MTHNLHGTLQTLSTESGVSGRYYSLPALEAAGIGRISRLPVSIRIVLESVLRNCDGKKVTEEHVRQLANWAPNASRTEEIPFIVARVVLQDFTGVPLLCDLAAMRGVAQRVGKDPKVIEPLVPVDLVVDHSVQVDYYGTKNALDLNMKVEFQRNAERYKFMKWGMQAFDTFKVVPPGVGIVHQVNLEYLARGVHQKDGVYYPDTLVGTDSHTTMINGIGVVAWGVGGIEAEAGMLGQPLYMLTPDVVGVHLKGRLREGVTATDLVLTVTELLRKAKVVGKFVEYFGEGAASLVGAGSRDDRQHVARVRRDDGLLRRRRQDDRISDQYRKDSGRDRSAGDLLPRAGSVRHAGRGHDRLFADGRARPGHGSRQPRRPEASAGSHRTAEDEGIVRHAVLQAGRRERVRAVAGQARPPLSGSDRSRPRAALERFQAALAGQRPAAQRGRDGRQPSDAGSGPRAEPETARHRQRRRPDRRNYILHQHVESRRVACRRTAGEKSGRQRPDGQAPHQDFAGTRIAGGHRVPEQVRAASRARKAQFLPGRLRLHDLHRQFGAARSLDRGGDHQKRSGMRGGPFGQSQLRGPHPSEHQGELSGLAATGCRLRDRRPGQHRFDHRASRHRQRRKSGLFARRLADLAGNRRGDAVRDRPGDLSSPVR